MSKTKQRYAAENGILFDRAPGESAAQSSGRRWRRRPNVKGPTRFFQESAEREPRTEADAIALAKLAQPLR